MIKLGWTISTAIVKGFREIKTRITSKLIESTQTAFPFGFDANPSKNFIAIIADTESNGNPVILGYLNPAALASLGIGDSAQYSTDSEGKLMASLILRSDGTVEILSNQDNAVRYSKLQTAYDELQKKVNDLVTAFNQHVHPTAATGPPSPPTPVPSVIPATPSAGDITASKIDEIKVPN